MVSRVFEICNAYESGYGHGYQKDGKDGKYYSDHELNEAYGIGYKAGFDAMTKEKVLSREGFGLLCRKMNQRKA